MKLFESRHQAQKQLLMRRTFLKAIGLGIAAPLAFKMSKLAIAQSSKRPSRLFIFFLPHGAPNEHYEVMSGGGGMDLGASGVGILSPLEPYKEYLTVLRGLSNTVPGGNHAAITSVLTGRQTENSIDYEIARALGTTAHVLGVQSYRANSAGPDDDCKVVRHGGWVTPIQNPYDALEDLFGGLGSGPPAAGGEEPLNEAEFRAEALDLNISEIQAMQQSLKGLTTEQNKLQIHLESLLGLKEAAKGGDVISCEARPSLPTAESMKGQDPFAAQNFGKALDGHLEAAAAALTCGSSRIITLQIMHANAQLPMDFPGGPGYTKNHHDPLSHSWDQAGREEFAKVQKWFYARLADKFLAALDQPDPADPEHTVLDNTTILTCSEIADGANHHSDHKEDFWLDGKPRPSYLPWVILGKGAGLFKGNQLAHVENVDHRNILAACAESMGVSIPTIAGESVKTPEEVKA